MIEKYELGQRALAKSKCKIGCLLNTWDYEKNGKPTPEKISKLLPMGINTVKKHLIDFRSQINKIETKELERLAKIEEKRQFIVDWYANYKLKKAGQLEENNKKTESNEYE